MLIRLAPGADYLYPVQSGTEAALAQVRELINLVSGE